MSLDLNTIDPVLKQLYRDENQDVVIADKNPFLALVPKFEMFTGRNMPVIPQYGRSESISSTFSVAQNAALSEASKWGEFLVTRVTKHGVALIEGDAIAAAGDDKGAFIRAVKQETDGIMKGMVNRRAQEVYGQGWGEIGQVATGSISGATLRLARVDDVVKVEKGQQHVFSASLAGAGLRGTAGVLTVQSVNRSTGVITYTANVSTISGGNGSVANGDFIFIRGDRQDSATPSRLCLTGIEGWVPFTAPTSGDNFYGEDRSQDVTRLAGQRLDGSNAPLEEVLLEADAIVTREGGAPDHCIVSPSTYANLAKSLGSRVRYQPLSVGKVGFQSLAVTGQNGDIKVIADRNCPSDRMYVVTLDTWELCSHKKLVRLNDDDGLSILRGSSADSVEVRVVSRANLICRAPAFNCTVRI